MKSRLFSLVMIVVAMSMLTGCTNWKKKHADLNVEYENLNGRYENCLTGLESSASQTQALGSELAAKDQEIADLLAQIEAGNADEGDTGFKGDVSVDAAAGTITVTLPNTLLFTSGKAALKKTTISELDHILSVLKERYRGMPVDVVGHTDSDPIRKSKWADNWQLSAERALSVLRYMVKRGIDDEDIRAVAAGSSRNIESNSTTSGKARNRRVEVVVYTR